MTAANTAVVLLPTEVSSHLGAGHFVWVCNVPVDGEDGKNIYPQFQIYEISYIHFTKVLIYPNWKLFHFYQMKDHRSYALNLSIALQK